MKSFWLQNRAHIGLLIVRVAFGMGMFIRHGLPKLEKLTSGEPEILFYNFAGLGAEVSLTLAVLAELVCAGLLTLGLLTRLSLLPLIFTMLIAYFVVHAADPFAQKEMAFLYLTAYIGLFFTGPGKFSIDGFIKSQKSKKQSVY